MKFCITSIILFILLTFSVVSQENPKIDVDYILSGSENVETGFITHEFNEGEKFYRKEFYEGSFRAFSELYKITRESAVLNYKLGVSALYGGRASEAADFLLESLPGVAGDYYLQLGYALQARLHYSAARDAFEKYNNTLSKRGKKNFREYYNQLVRECDFGENNATDSVPSFVINAGPAVNSYYNEYGAVENSRHNRIFYTSRRPERLPDVPGNRDKFDERILQASYVDQEVAEGNEVSRLNSRFHSGIAGISPDEDFLFVYKGKKRSGQIRVADITGKKVKKSDYMSSRIDHKVFKETTFAETSDGRVFFVSERTGGMGGKDIWTVTRKGHGRFSKPKNMGSVINTPFDEEGVFVTPDGNTLYFASRGHAGFGGYDIYKSGKNRNGEWMIPENAGQPVNSPQDDLFFFPTSDPQVAFISSSRPGGYGGLDIYKIKKDIRIPFSIMGKVTDKETGNALDAKVSLFDTYKKEQIISERTDSLTGEYFMAVEDSGSYVLQVGAEGYKIIMADVFSPRVRNSEIRKDFKLDKLKHPYTLKGKITDVDTFEPVQAEIIFKSVGSDSVTHRIFSDRNTGEYLITFGDKFNLSMTVSAKDYHIFSSQLFLKNTIGSLEENNVELERSVMAYTVSGRILEEETNVAVPGELAFFKPGEDNAFVVRNADPVSGKYSVTVYEPGPFLIEITADGYFFSNSTLQFHSDSTLKVKNIIMQPMSAGASIVAENILFTSGKATLRAESYPEINRLVRLLNDNPSVSIEVSGHTDNTGSASLNKRLSKARALSVKRYLESQGIDPVRLEYEGYGFDQPIVPNTTVEGRAQNRRVEIKVIE